MDGCTVLFVDDDGPNRHLMSRLFQRRRPEDRLLLAASAPEAIQSARLHSPDLVLLDVNLGGSSGEEVLTVLGAEASMPIVMVTGGVDETIEQRLRELGAAAIVMKPFEADALFTLIESLLP